MSKKILSLSGLKGSGKDSICKGLKEGYLNKNIERLAWADPLKKEVSEIFRIPLNLLHADEETKNNTLTEITVGIFLHQAKKIVPWKKWFTTFGLSQRSLTVREVLQYWGTEVRRAQDPDYWVKLTSEKIEKSNADLIVLTDTRFDNEIEYVHKNQGVTVWLERKDPDQKDVHESEKKLETMFTVKTKGYQSIGDSLIDVCEILHKSKLEFE